MRATCGVLRGRLAGPRSARSRLDTQRAGEEGDSRPRVRPLTMPATLLSTGAALGTRRALEPSLAVPLQLPTCQQQETHTDTSAHTGTRTHAATRAHSACALTGPRAQSHTCPNTSTSAREAASVRTGPSPRVRTRAEGSHGQHWSQALRRSNSSARGAKTAPFVLSSRKCTLPCQCQWRNGGMCHFLGTSKHSAPGSPGPRVCRCPATPDPLPVTVPAPLHTRASS